MPKYSTHTSTNKSNSLDGYESAIQNFEVLNVHVGSLNVALSDLTAFLVLVNFFSAFALDLIQFVSHCLHFSL